MSERSSEPNPYQPPASKVLDVPDSTSVWRRSKSLVIRRDAELPDRCIYCNVPTRLVKRRRLFYLNIWLQIILVLLLVVFNVLALIPVLIVLLIFRKSIVLDIPVCPVHWRRRIYLTVSTLLLLTASLALAFLSIDIRQHQEVLLGLSLGCFFLSIVMAAVTGRMLRASKIDADVAILKGAKKPFLDSLPEYDEVGR